MVSTGKHVRGGGQTVETGFYYIPLLEGVEHKLESGSAHTNVDGVHFPLVCHVFGSLSGFERPWQRDVKSWGIGEAAREALSRRCCSRC